MNRKLVVLLLCLFSMNYVRAQRSDQQVIADTVLGWQKVYSFKGKKYAPVTKEGRSYTPYQVAIADSFTSWFQKTYTPIGGWGTVTSPAFLTAREAMRPYGVGTDFLIWNVTYSADRKRLEKVSETWTPVYMYTNLLFGINPVWLLNPKEKAYFTMPKDNYAASFGNPAFEKLVKPYGLHEGDRFSKYLVYFYGPYVTVVLIPGNQLPIVAVTKGEFLQQCERALAQAYEKDKKDIIEASPNNLKQQAAFIKHLDEEKHPRRIKWLAAVKEKYRNQLDEPAVLNYFSGPDATAFQNNDPIFIEDATGTTNGGYPLYKYAEGVIEKSRQDKPLWVSIAWRPEKPGGAVKESEIHRAMLRYFNFDYVYAYFFQPEKVKGKPYTVTNGEEQAARLKSRKEYLQVKPAQLAAGQHFKEDFSGTAIGNAPNGWYIPNKSRDAVSVVTNVAGYPGNWLKMAQGTFQVPTPALGLPLPEDFTLAYDLLTTDFSGRQGHTVTLKLLSSDYIFQGKPAENKQSTKVLIRVAPGNEENLAIYPSDANITIKFPDQLNRSYTSYGIAPGTYTNKKRLAHVVVKKKGQQVTVMINGQTVPYLDYNKADKSANMELPKGVRFTYVDWYYDIMDADRGEVYLGNISITNE